MANADKLDRAAGQERATAPSVDRIIEAATELFAEYGYDSTITQISEAAGVSRGLLLYHFGSKEGILEAVVDHATAEAAEVFQQPDDLTGIAALRAYLESRSRFFRERPKLARLLMVIGAEATSAHRSRPALLDIEDRKLAFLTKCLAEAVKDGTVRADLDVHKIALLLAAVTDGDIRMWGLDPKRRPIDDTNDAILTMLRMFGSP